MTCCYTCLLALALFCKGALNGPIGNTAIDLSYNIGQGLPVWHNVKDFNIDILVEPNLGDYILQTENIQYPSHLGTHISAPKHFYQDRKSVDQIPESSLRGPAVVIDASAQAVSDPNYAITVEDLKAFEEQNGPIPDNSIVLFKTGWAQHWKDSVKYLGLNENKDFTKVNHPGLSGEAADWLVKERNILAVGIDTAALSPGNDKDFKAFKSIFSADKYAVMNLANLDRLQSTGIMLYVFPIRFVGASGSPTRVVAFT